MAIDTRGDSYVSTATPPLGELARNHQRGANTQKTQLDCGETQVLRLNPREVLERRSAHEARGEYRDVLCFHRYPSRSICGLPALVRSSVDHRYDIS
ncbi:hypothetical protein RB614_44035 [Phytohabitans sp. ZYX-F-186]|uniref:Uncharacterized protein n=1 Tax=Phytohabitans maris TaxID=3071409 RepID=A0ABU0ZWQ6_9ACTN|nr:hypothetical protein [Phytohabitans sp. ZYX-F-186]MDQ7911478.1 hypothetical protein [Phytohabitans sp. ZYX-F-186]